MAWATLRERGRAHRRGGRRAARRRARVIVSGVLVNVLNPKLTIFFFAFLPQFVDAATRLRCAMLPLSGVVHARDVRRVRRLRRLRRGGPHASRLAAGGRDGLRRTFAGAFVALGARLAVESR
jgi:threonine/homoserine/homoserine lactone efflux protein